jgi:ABC-type glycerol-3-phosphate transport system substrate-binding protein
MARSALTLVALLAALTLVACGQQPSVKEAQQPGLGNTPVPSSAPATGSSASMSSTP